MTQKAHVFMVTLKPNKINKCCPKIHATSERRDVVLKYYIDVWNNKREQCKLNKTVSVMQDKKDLKDRSYVFSASSKWWE